ncbi:TAXI family TRAP transporter solute-binding subunit [Salipiger sp. HF18]|uniref:TAXI family TRAP transporter solute-binding subunit n=1 Tax=Salipiger sp. HF18 TaxID=2721557 RepID=UPI0020CAB433|nr:TAXI family TRAP transporter solute-binding subunit [Salipiger sp. HF18]
MALLGSAFIRGTVAAVAIFAGQAVLADEVTLPRTMVWTSYDLGSTGYVEASAMADALDKNYGTTVRLTPSGTGIGRMLPLAKKRATFGFMGNEIFFASEGMFEFAARDWGPQEVRVLLGRPAAVGLITGLDTDIESVADLKGRKVGFVQASPSTLMNTEAALAFGDLTVDDVEQVIYPGYGAMVQGFIAGEIDAVPVTPTVSALREAEGGRGVRWLDMPGSDSAGWDRVRASATIFSPTSRPVGVSISEDDPAELLGYRYPQLTAYADTSEDEVYNLVKALDESYDLFKDANGVIARWNMQDAGSSPAGAPFHPGAIKYLREKGVWDAEDDAWNETRIARLEAVKSAWAAATEKADAEKVSDEDWPAFWDSYRSDALN